MGHKTHEKELEKRRSKEGDKVLLTEGTRKGRRQKRALHAKCTYRTLTINIKNISKETRAARYISSRRRVVN